MIHELKTDSLPFDAVLWGIKRFEYRKNDRNFQVGDYLVLKEVDDQKKNTGREIIAHVAFVLCGPDYDVPEGYCVMSFNKLSE